MLCVVDQSSVLLNSSKLDIHSFVCEPYKMHMSSLYSVEYVEMLRWVFGGEVLIDKHRVFCLFMLM